MKKYDSMIIKYAQQNNDAMADAVSAPMKKIDNVIKRAQINYTYEQKYRLGILTEAEYYFWQLELQQQAEEARRAAEEGSISQEEAEALNALWNGEDNNSAAEFDSSKHTFWEGEDGDRENISSDAYEDFLKANSIDVSNRTSTSFDDLKALALGTDNSDEESESGSLSEEDQALQDEVARIQALFMPTQGNIDQLFAQNTDSDDENN